jgi:hypothetical protein
MSHEVSLALVAYESMFGATRQIAEAIAEGLADDGVPVDIRAIRDVRAIDPGPYDLVVLGAPTHAHSLPTGGSRAEGERWLDHRMRGHRLEPRARELGLREWIPQASLAGRRLAAFTTRADLPRLLSGSAVPAIERLARAQGARTFVPGFAARVDEHGDLLPGDADLARQWGRDLVSRAALRSAVSHG